MTINEIQDELIEEFETEPKGECVITVLPEESAEPNADPAGLMDDLLKSMSVKDAASCAAEALSHCGSS